jgi:methionine-rich copper-binding protein CopC
MNSRLRRSFRLRVPVWLIVLAALLTASVIAERAKAATEPPDLERMEHHPRASWLTSGRGIAFALTFDQIVSHGGSQVTLVTPTGRTRNVPIRLIAQPNTLYATVGGLEPGSYVLRWDAQAADGVRLRGSLPFNVGQNMLAGQF